MTAFLDSHDVHAFVGPYSHTAVVVACAELVGTHAASREPASLIEVEAVAVKKRESGAA